MLPISASTKVTLFDSICESIKKDGSIWGPTQYVFKRALYIGWPVPILLRAEMRSRKNVMGRFGGGWNWDIGAKWSSWRFVIINLFVMSVHIHVGKGAHESYTRLKTLLGGT